MYLSPIKSEEKSDGNLSHSKCQKSKVQKWKQKRKLSKTNDIIYETLARDSSIAFIIRKWINCYKINRNAADSVIIFDFLCAFDDNYCWRGLGASANYTRNL